VDDDTLRDEFEMVEVGRDEFASPQRRSKTQQQQRPIAQYAQIRRRRFRSLVPVIVCGLRAVAGSGRRMPESTALTVSAS
jgi:hypothetical protein